MGLLMLFNICGWMTSADENAAFYHYPGIKAGDIVSLGFYNLIMHIGLLANAMTRKTRVTFSSLVG